MKAVRQRALSEVDMSIRVSPAILTVLLCLLPSVPIEGAAGGRVKGTVVDESGEPIPDVSVTIVNNRIAFREEMTTNKKGQFVVAFVDASERYEFRFEKDGFQTTIVDFKPAVGGNLRQEFRMPRLAATDVQGGAVGEERTDAAVEAFNEGVTAAKAGDFALAATKFEEARKRSPNRPEPYAALASLYADQGRFDDAEKMAARALELDPEAVRPLLVLYDVYTSRDDDAKANEALARLQAKGGNEAAVRIYNAGVEAAGDGDMETAIRLLEQSTQADPSFAPAQGALASIHLARGEYEEALAAADRALEADPGFDKVHQVRYDAYRALGDEAAANDAFEQMAAADPVATAEALYVKGKALFESGNVAEAMDSLERAVTLDEGNARAHYMLGLCYLNAGRTADARRHLEIFLELAPDDPEVDNARAMLEYAG